MALSESSNFDEAPEISVVISTYNRPSALARCLNALLLQNTSHRIEIIVVNNCPQPGISPAISAQFPSVRWLQEPLPGLSRARNLGVGAARGIVIVTTDDDVIPPPDWLEQLTRPLFEEDGPSVTTGNCLPWKVETPAEALFEAYGGLRHGDEPLCFDREWMTQWNIQQGKIGFPQLWRIGTTANAAFLSAVLGDPRIGPFETRLGAGTRAGAWEDLYSFYRILNAGYRICYLPQACLLHAHREQMDALGSQLCAYRRGETAFLTMMLTRHRDLRALGQMFLWIPYWRLGLLNQELARRLRGTRLFSLRLFWQESLAYLAGPWAWWSSRD
jgi:GT2 family glycosyltransferase